MGLILGPMNHFWYKFLDAKVKDSVTCKRVLKKITADMLVSPIFAATFISGVLFGFLILFLGIAILEGKSVKEALDEYRRKFFHVLMVSSIDWT